MRNLESDDLMGLLLFVLSAFLTAFMVYRHREVRIALRRLTAIVILLMIASVLMHFPYDYDTPAASAGAPDVEKKYTDAYAGELEKTGYEDVFAIVHEQSKREVTGFIECYGLKEKSVLEVGAGTGYLQDLVDNYTGLDIAPTAQQFFHKRFVVGSATALPFPNSEFDVIWSIYVFEHVNNPEQGFAEARRVLRNGGLFFLSPAWNCPVWLAEGYEVRSFSDFNLWGKMIKASLIMRTQPLFILSYSYPIRFLRLVSASLSQNPTRLRYKRLRPNLAKYWVPDSDAVNSIDRFEAIKWFLSRGDECLNCSTQQDFWRQAGPVILRINKQR